MQPSGWVQMAVGAGIGLMGWFGASLSIIQPQWQETVRWVGVVVGLVLVILPLAVQFSRRRSPVPIAPSAGSVAPSITGQGGGTSIVAGRDVSYTQAPPQRDLTAVRIRIATLRGEGVQLYARNDVRTEDQFQAWSATWDAWGASVSAALNEHDPSMRLRFENIGAIMAADVTGSFNPLHNQRRLILSRQLAILDGLISEIR